MLKFQHPVKFLGIETREFPAKKEGADPFVVTEAKLFVPDLGRVKVKVLGKVDLPPLDSSVHLSLDVEQGKFQALQPVWNDRSNWKAA